MEIDVFETKRLHLKKRFLNKIKPWGHLGTGKGVVHVTSRESLKKEKEVSFLFLNIIALPDPNPLGGSLGGA